MASEGRDARVSALLPTRYAQSGREPFDRAVEERMTEAKAVLDLGGGRHPTIDPSTRPPGVEYVGLDASEAELLAAKDGSYSELVVADAGKFVPKLEGRFDLIVSWQVLEHVRDFGEVARNVRRYLRPGGTLIARFSGSRAVFALVNRLLPDRVGSRLVDRIMGRTASNEPVFPATYDGCDPRSIARNFADWSEVSLEPVFTGATYFRFSIPLMRGYLLYENAIALRRIEGLATHYLLIARR